LPATSLPALKAIRAVPAGLLWYGPQTALLWHGLPTAPPTRLELCDACFADPAWTPGSNAPDLDMAADSPEKGPEAAPLLAALALGLFAGNAWEGREEALRRRKPLANRV
jgi:hypothetical protein